MLNTAVIAPVNCPTRLPVSIVRILPVTPFGKAFFGVTVVSGMCKVAAPPPSGGGAGGPAGTMLASTSQFSTSWLRCLMLSMI